MLFRSALSAFLLIASGVAIIASSPAGAMGRKPFPLALLLFVHVGFLLFVERLRVVTFSVMADAPALALAVFACAVVAGSDPARPLRLLAAGLLMALATWTKATVFGVAAGAGLFLLASRGWKPALLLGLFLVGWIAVIGLLVLLFVDAEALCFYTLRLPFSYPWKEGSLFRLLAQSGQELMLVSLPLIVFAAAAFALRCRGGAMGFGGPWREWVRGNRWLVYAMTALFSVPGAVMSYCRWGGDVNHYALVAFFILASGLALLSACPAGDAEEGWGRVVLAGFVAPLAILLAVRCFPSPGAVRRIPAALRAGPQHTAYRYLREHPGQVFFPRHPLAALFAEGRLYHVDDYSLPALRGYGVEIAPSRLREYVPENMQYIAVWAPWKESSVRRELPEYNRPVRLPGLDGWTVFARGSGAP